MTVAELRAKLSMIEPTESMYSGITPSDMPALDQLLADKEPWMAARATFALSRIGSVDAVQVLAKAATDERPQVRVAVAAAVGQTAVVLPDSAVSHLLQDADPGVRKFATQAVKKENGPDPHTILRRIAAEDAVPIVREHATEALRKLR